MQYRVGDTVRGSVVPLNGEPVSYGTYRITAVRGMRVYVDHVDGAKFCRGINGWTNLWFAVDDVRVCRCD